MEDEKYKKELFEFDKPRRSFPRLPDIFSKVDFDNRVAVTLTLERIIFMAIGLIMLMVVTYALGVEMGKRGAAGSAVLLPENKISLVKAPQIANDAQVAGMPQPVKAHLTPAALKPAAKPQTPPGSIPTQNSAKPYTIFAATFSHREYAAQEMAGLKKTGFDAYIVQSGSMFRLCVGSYPSTAAAQKDLLRVKRTYKDAYLKAR